VRFDQTRKERRSGKRNLACSRGDRDAGARAYSEDPVATDEYDPARSNDSRRRVEYAVGNK
jgi:hypothetical protein